eukprot:1797558-Pyramimonas_sp.AAC.1
MVEDDGPTANGLERAHGRGHTTGHQGQGLREDLVGLGGGEGGRRAGLGGHRLAHRRADGVLGGHLGPTKGGLGGKGSGGVGSDGCHGCCLGCVCNKAKCGECEAQSAPASSPKRIRGINV